MCEIQIVEEFKKRVHKIHSKAAIYSYDSIVNKSHWDDSDYNVLVTLDEINPNVRDIVYDIAWGIEFEYDAFISPVLTAKDELVRLSASPILQQPQAKWVTHLKKRILLLILRITILYWNIKTSECFIMWDKKGSYT
jgi:hypothetical protein